MDLPDLSEPVCPTCEDGFDSFRSFSAHNAAVHGGNALVNIVGEETLGELYASGSEHDVADELGVNQVTVHNALQSIEVDTSNPRHSEYPNLIMSQGYERITHKDHQVLHHRLLAVAKFGFDAVTGNVVHHRNGISWDNRPENIELMTQTDHIRTHGLPKLKTQ